MTVKASLSRKMELVPAPAGRDAVYMWCNEIIWILTHLKMEENSHFSTVAIVCYLQQWNKMMDTQHLCSAIETWFCKMYFCLITSSSLIYLCLSCRLTETDTNILFSERQAGWASCIISYWPRRAVMRCKINRLAASQSQKEKYWHHYQDQKAIWARTFEYKRISII